MIAFSLESVLIGDPAESDRGAVGTGVRVGSASDSADVFSFRSDLFLVTSGAQVDSVFTGKAVNEGRIFK